MKNLLPKDRATFQIDTIKLELRKDEYFDKFYSFYDELKWTVKEE